MLEITPSLFSVYHKHTSFLLWWTQTSDRQRNYASSFWSMRPHTSPSSFLYISGYTALHDILLVNAVDASYDLPIFSITIN